MQIQYCDDCGTRVDETEITTVAGKLYCKQCAKNHAPQPKAVGTGIYTGPRPSTRVTRMTKTPTPGRGGTKLADNFNPEFSNAAEREYQEEFIAPPSSSPVVSWAKRNTAFAISIAAGLVGVLLIVLWSALSGPPKNNTAVSPSPNKIPPVVTTTDSKNTVATVTGTKPVPTPAVVAPNPGDFDPRTDKAVRDLAQIKELIAGNKANPFDIRKRLEKLVEPFWIKKTPMGIEGEKLLAQFKNERRPPDKADGAQPGVQAHIGFPKAVEIFNTDFKPAEVKTLANIDIPSVDALKAALGHDVDVAVKFIGFVEVPKDGEYTFYVTSDDGSMLYIGDLKIVDNAGTHAATERDGSIDLKAGKHAFRLDYYNGSGAATVTFSWSGPGLIKQTVPASALSSIPNK